MKRRRSLFQQIKEHPVATMMITLLVAVIVLMLLSILGYIYNWGWTGLAPYISPPHPQSSDYQRGKTLWDWLQLLVIPVVLAIGGYFFNYTVSRNERKAADQRNQTEREIASDNQREQALQAYIDKMSELLLHENLRESKPEDEIRKIARVRTLTVLTRLDGERKRNLLLFLYESGLIFKDHIIIDLQGADLSNADLKGVDLHGAMLHKVNLYGSSMAGINLHETDLSEANLSHTYESGADLSKANLTRARFNGAEIYHANFAGANLTGTSFEFAWLRRSNISPEQLSKVISLAGATLPDGTKIPDPPEKK